MFGPDTSLVIDAIQIGIIALGAGVGGTMLLRRFRRSAKRVSEPSAPRPSDSPARSLEDRVRVLERIATDRPDNLAAEIEALRDSDITRPANRREHA